MNEDYSADLITLIDDEGENHEFQILDAIETDDGRYVALLPISGPAAEQEEGTYYIFEVIEEDGEEQLAEVEDEDLLNKLAESFESRFDELYGEEDEEITE